MYIPSFENALKVQIVVFEAHLGNKGVHQVPERRRRIFTIKRKIEHFDAVMNIKGLLTVSLFCHKYLKSKRNCTIACRVYRSDNCEESNSMTFSEYNMSYRSH